MGRVEIRFVGVQLSDRRRAAASLLRSRIEKHRRLFELVEDKDQHPEQQDEELHRDFAHGIEHQAQPAFAQRSAGKVTLHLRLVGAEIGQQQKYSAEQPGPERVALVDIDRKIHGVQFLKSAGQGQRVGEGQSGGQLCTSRQNAVTMPAKMTAI